MFVGKEGDGESTSQVDVLISQAKWGRSFDVLPGVSSGIAAPVLAGIPVSTSTFATAHLADRDPDRPKFALAETLAFFTARQRLAHVASSLSPAGHSQSTPASLVVSGSWASQHVIDGTLATLGQELEAHERTQSRASGAPWRLHEVIGPALAPRRDPKPPLRSFS